LDW
jgi:high-affinity iron transporter